MCTFIFHRKYCKYKGTSLCYVFHVELLICVPFIIFFTLIYFYLLYLWAGRLSKYTDYLKINKWVQVSLLKVKLFGYDVFGWLSALIRKSIYLQIP